MPVAQFAADGPPFDPVRFFQGPIHSWGVLENRSGGPTDVVRTEGVGVAEGADGVALSAARPGRSGRAEFP